jgi:hypothetical protein
LKKPFAPIPKDEVILSVAVYHPTKNYKAQVIEQFILFAGFCLFVCLFTQQEK